MATEVGVRYPFSINGGRVVTTSNQTDILTSQVTFCLGTQTGERVMRPLWGTNIMQSAFEMEGAGVKAVVSDAIHNAFRRWFQDTLAVKRLTFIPNLDQPGVLTVDVTFGNYGSGTDVTVRTGVPTGGAEIYGNEGSR